MLDDKTVKAYLDELGYASVKAFQQAVLYPKYVDGIYGQQTENALISAINVKRNTKNFTVQEFRCECGGKYCCGYPSTLKVEMLRNIQAIRDHYNRPVIVTCGLRDKTYNSKMGGSIQNSLHLSGRAVDFYQKGVTDTLANRKLSIKWIKTLPNHHYTYGNGINSYGNGVSAPYMGNALHTDVTVKTSPYDENGKLIVDGSGGTATVKETQRFLGTVQDGVISNQNATLIKKYCPSLIAYTSGTGGSACVKYLQKWLSVSQDGIIGQATVKAWQTRLKTEGYYTGDIDGCFGTGSMKAWQKYLNTHDKADYPTTWVDKANAWAKDIANSKYHYVVWNSKVDATKTCPICKGRKYDNYYGWNCIGYASAVWKHGGGLKNYCNCSTISNAIGEQMYNCKTDAEALAIAKKRLGLNDLAVIRNKSGIPKSQWKPGDICLQFSGSTYKHMFYYMGNGKVSDAGNYKTVSKQIAVRDYASYSAKIIIRYTGK